MLGTIALRALVLGLSLYPSRSPWHFTSHLPPLYTLLGLLWEAALAAVEALAKPFSGDYDAPTPRYQIASLGGLCDDVGAGGRAGLSRS